MCSIVQYIFEIVMVLTTIWIVNKFLNILFEKKKRNIFTMTFWLMYILLQIIIRVYNISASIWITLGSIVLVIAISICGYEKVGFLKGLAVVLLYTVWTIVEVIVFYCISILDLAESNAYLVGLVVSTIIMIILTYLLMLFWREHTDKYIPFSLKYNCLLVFIPIGSIYIALCYFYLNVKATITFFTLLVFVFLLLFNIIVFEIYIKLAEIFWLERERVVYSQQIEMFSKNTEAQKKVMEQFHEERHNWINKLIVLKNNFEDGNNINVIEEINKIIKNCDANERISDSGNNTIDAIINFKYSLAKEQGIMFNLKIFVPIELSINQCDLGIVLGNALDNAIEATQKCKYSKKEINISMGIKKEALIIVIDNPYEHSIIQNKMGTMLSTKNETIKHGYGINSIIKTIDKYDGEVVIDTNDNIFTLTIIMHLAEF